MHVEKIAVATRNIIRSPFLHALMIIVKTLYLYRISSDKISHCDDNLYMIYYDVQKRVKLVKGREKVIISVQ